MALLIVQLRVRDYRKWHRAYEAHRRDRRRGGLGSAQLYRGADDQHRVAIVFGVKDIDKAKTFIGSDDLRKTMKAAGVIGKPSVTFVDAGVLPVPHRVTPVGAGKHRPRDKPPEASADAWKRFQQALQASQKGPAKSSKTAIP